MNGTNIEGTHDILKTVHVVEYHMNAVVSH